MCLQKVLIGILAPPLAGREWYTVRWNAAPVAALAVDFAPFSRMTKTAKAEQDPSRISQGAKPARGISFPCFEHNHSNAFQMSLGRTLSPHPYVQSFFGECHSRPFSNLGVFTPPKKKTNDQ